ncbi:PREDICTED: uncharacterized protein LOC109341897 [Lupinus angustifolius]|uniref:uncharacterized protein LOC109339070 n=1 Tax=Lupinus angustifolius TaxID=3871 RepID=UPI00092ED9C2|nr:PREDICTED: uncharacterized protein LOC109339070 [Lupinus angustifolius]XP_019432193.1 PREDICTED: uncharacterized protein LOC109339211 [Lupinus angustifolius]XP_019435414.1 PREDICTED: uncharacterized protein LOC109341897 [Lupinus angustifolius]
MSDLGNLSYFLGLQFTETENGFFMHQSKYALDVLERFQMQNCNSASTPVETGNSSNSTDEDQAVDHTLFRQMIGCLRDVCNTRPGIAYGVGVVSRFIKTITHSMVGYSDTDWCGDKDDRKSTSGYVFMLGDSPIPWCSKKQNVVGLSSCEAEYISACMAVCQSVWLETLLKELKLRKEGRRKHVVNG